MNDKFRPYGVYIDQVNIMYIVLPKDLREVLTGTSKKDVELQSQVKFQENRMLKFRNAENMKMLTLKRDNQKKISRLNHIIDVENIQ